jgi:pimeloyl-ACP methyl ester carboxylesterase
MPTRDTAVDSAVNVFADFSGPTFDPDEFRAVAERAVTRSYRPDGTARQLAAILSSPDRTSRLQTLRLPALVIHGLHDTLVQMSGGIATAKAIPGARLVLFNDMGHDLPSTRSQDIADEIASVAAHAGTRHPAPV